MKKLYIIPVLLLFGHMAIAQNEEDIVRYSMTTNTGTARSSAMGGAFGALGGDLSSFSTNPAGIGVFRKSEISITPYLNVANTKSDNSSIRKSSFQLGSFGGVVAIYNGNFDWKGFNFGINYTNLNNFNRKTNQFVYDSPTNFPQVWANEANWSIANGNGTPARSEMAYNVRLIEWIEDTKQYEPNLFPGENVNQHKYIQEEGYQGEYDFSFGTNYKDKLYLGLTIGIQSIRYKYKSLYTGQPIGETYLGIDYYNFDTYLKTEGVGTNFKVGVIYRPIPELRLGAAIHTPTYFSMTDHYEETMYSKFFLPDDDGYYDYDSYLYPTQYNYDMQTPWKALFSVATVLKQKVILSVDYEFNNYNSAKFSKGEDGYDYSEPGGPNELVREYLKNTNNFRVGAEYRVNSIFSVRSGYSYWDSPYRYTKTAKIQSVSGGFGLNFGVFFCDAAYIYKFSKNTTNFYSYLDPEDSIYDVVANPVSNKYQTHEGKITFGVRF